MTLSHWAVAWTLFCFLGPASAAQALAVSQCGVARLGPTAIDQFGQAFAVTGMSGVTHLGDGRFAAVMDNSNRLVLFDVIFASDGTLRSATIIGGFTLEESFDFEGIAWSGPAEGSVHVSEEATPAVREYSLIDGHPLRVHATPEIFTAKGHLVPNKGFEALALRADGTQLWVANEEALTVDGVLSNRVSGSVVRLILYLRSGGEFVPSAQFAYVTEPLHGVAVPNSASGLVDLVALPDGGVLTLERSLALGVGVFKTSIFALDFTNATDVSLPPFASGLIGTKFTPVQKSLLFSTRSLGQNLEGLALGPPLAAGGVALLGVVDDGDPLSGNTVVAFQLTGESVSATASFGPCPFVALTSNAPVALGGLLTMDVSAPTAPFRPVILVADVARGPILYPQFDNAMVALTSSLMVLAGPTGTGGSPGPSALTDGEGAFTLSTDVPSSPSLSGLSLLAQAAVLDAFRLKPSKLVQIDLL